VRAVDLIAKKRDGGVHDGAEIRFLVDGFLDGRVAPEQMSAWCMAVVWRGLDDAEIDALCAAMVESGDVVDLAPLGRTVVDKHSTGGVGDKVTLALAPLVAACGVPVAKMSGRGLGHTGGTLDKLEAIPGYRIAIPIAEFIELVRDVGCAVVAQTAQLVPADSKIYALRDITGTVSAPGLIATSVMSKKLASGAGAMVLDVKVGDGAFCRTVAEARELARLMHGLGTRAGRRVVCEITRMDAPLGCAVGNALEVAEAFDVLRGTAPTDVTEVVRTSAVRLLALAEPGLSDGAAGARVEDAIASGRALEAARRWVAAQGGDARAVDEPWSVMERAPLQHVVAAPRGGHVEAVGALAVGLAAVRLGAGRSKPGEAVDHAVGIVLAARPGDVVEAGAPLATIHARDTASAEAAAADVAAAYRIGDGPVAVPGVLLETIA
jgi:pyrimidine-nucleoside phosphorylase